MEKTNCGIYKIVNVINNKCYIGSSSNLKNRKYVHFKQLREDKHCNNYLQRAYNKYKEENFIWTILEYVEKIDSKKELNKKLIDIEQSYLDKYKLKNNKINKKICYNLSPMAGSQLGYNHTEETKNKFKGNTNGKGNKGKKRTEESKQKYRESHLGLKHSLESKIRRSEVSKGENNPFFNKNHTEETKIKMRKPKTEEHKKKISNSRIKKKIINLTTGEIFDSMKVAEELMNIPHGNICNVCKGRCKTAGGYEWSYYG